MEPGERIELSTSFLPRKRSATEPSGRLISDLLLYNNSMLKPVEDKRVFNGPVAAKVGFLVLLLAGGLFLGSYKATPSKSGKAASPAVLGETIVKEAKGIGTRVKDLGTGTVKKVSSFVNEKKKQAGEKASEFVYSAGVHPILENFSKLPKTDQEKIRKELCAPGK